MGVAVRRVTFEVVMKHTVVLAVDAAINIVLGVLLIAFPRPLVDVLLGGVLLGIGIALVIQIAPCERPGGLGLWGAVAINLCGGFLLAACLLWGGLDISVRGRVFLRSLVAVLVGVSLVELTLQRTREGR
jgi:hypothetical protein